MGLLSKKERESTHSCECLSCFWSSIASISFPKSTIKYKKHIKKKKKHPMAPSLAICAE